jgi:hypothetical protein
LKETGNNTGVVNEPSMGDHEFLRRGETRKGDLVYDYLLEIS